MQTLSKRPWIPLEWKYEDRKEIEELEEHIEHFKMRMNVRLFDKDKRIRNSLKEIINGLEETIIKLRKRYKEEYGQEY